MINIVPESGDRQDVRSVKQPIPQLVTPTIVPPIELLGNHRRFKKPKKPHLYNGVWHVLDDPKGYEVYLYR